jgi:signal transduction histidine kinase
MFNYLSKLARSLLNLSGPIRLICVSLIFLGCSLLLLVYNLPSADDDSLFVIPVALATWLFTGQGAIVSFSASILMVALANTLTSHGLHWSNRLIHTFIGGFIALNIEAIIVLKVRHNLDLTDTAMKKARHAEEQSAIAYEQQRALNQLKDQFIITVNHELRTPLTEVHGYLDLLHEYNGTLQPDLQATFLEKAIHGCEELQVLVNTVLDALQAGNLERTPRALEPLSVLCLIQIVLEGFTPQHKDQYHIHIDIPAHLHILANAQYMRQVLHNYISNAFKYTPKQTAITISARLQVKETQDIKEADPSKEACTSNEAHIEEIQPFPQIIICVKDSGPGIPQAELPWLFNKFFRLARDQSGPIRGTGLGLFVCKQIVESMEGTAWVESEGIPGKGCSFYLSLPEAPQQSNSSDTPHFINTHRNTVAIAQTSIQSNTD